MQAIYLTKNYQFQLKKIFALAVEAAPRRLAFLPARSIADDVTLFMGNALIKISMRLFRL